MTTIDLLRILRDSGWAYWRIARYTGLSYTQVWRRLNPDRARELNHDTRRRFTLRGRQAIVDLPPPRHQLFYKRGY